MKVKKILAVMMVFALSLSTIVVDSIGVILNI